MNAISLSTAPKNDRCQGLEDFSLCRLHDLLDKISGQMEIFQA
jgi:hypothetical protein